MKKAVILILVFSSCKQSSIKNKQGSLDKVNDSLISTLVGKWGARTGEPVWEIARDSMYYFEEGKSYAYTIHSKDMVVKYKGSPFVLANIKVSKDTLFFTANYGGVIKAFRCR